MKVEELRDYISPEEAGAILGKSRHTIYRLLRKGVLPGTKIGGTWVIRRSEMLAAIDTAIERHRQEGLCDGQR